MVLVRVDCHYPNSDLLPTSVVFEPLGLGVSSAAVHGAFLRLLDATPYFEIETLSDGELPFCAETVRTVLVWEQPSAPPPRCSADET